MMAITTTTMTMVLMVLTNDNVDDISFGGDGQAHCDDGVRETNHGTYTFAPLLHPLPAVPSSPERSRAGRHPLQRAGAQQRRDGDEGFEGAGRRRDDDPGAVVVHGSVLGRQGVPLRGGERRGGQLSPEGKQGPVK